ncbi:quinoprotein dehydrogenase-associated SoxYZ-like carrier [uncultured Hyphomicrobium sp.]|uniref:quinoprotein dehydrogenase-associated SoxYZ-like carrier n=1 Tax=uncultured Hyphomicrobium sp. TaxID=194373 RepID=UPI0025FCEBC4|nr:quinoprotein dehydrogenase-associated SoxYZ-like carrier [uncultured Hyphomicrobium sp.]
MDRRFLLALASFFVCSHALAADPDLWPDLRQELFGDRAIVENDGTVTLYAPENAEDAALVPVSLRFPEATSRSIVAVTLLVERNPAPVAAVFKFGDAFRNGRDVGERQLATRIRVDSFSRVRAIAETADGTLHMVTRFVAGAGGCSATPSKDMEAALASMGKMSIKTMTEPVRGDAWRETQVMIKHPNFTGLQMDPISRGYVPARFVNDLEIKNGGTLLLRMEGGISISENPNLRFSYGSTASGDSIEVTARDTEGATFTDRSDGGS